MKRSDNIHIDLSNYEMFVMDYLEGTLPDKEAAAFIAFLENHPGLSDEIDGLELTTLEALPVSLPGKELLKKTAVTEHGPWHEENATEGFIAYAEGDLTPHERQSMETFVEINPRLQATFRMHQQLKLVPDPDVVYPDKASLRHRIGMNRTFAFRIAAGFLILLAAGWFFRPMTMNTRADIWQSVMSARQVQHLGAQNHAGHVLQNRALPVAVMVTEESQGAVNPDIAEPHTHETIARPQLAMASLDPRQPVVVEASTTTYDNATSSGVVYGSEVLAMNDQAREVEDPRSTMGKVLNRQWSAFTGIFAAGREKRINRRLQKDDPGFIKVLDQGILVFNTITGSETHVERSYNSNGHLTGYKVEGADLFVSRPVTASAQP